MNSETTSSTPRISESLAGQHILVTGATGFLAKAFIEKLLRSVETIGGIHLLVRPRAGGRSPRERVEREVLGSPAFDRLRATMGDRFQRLCDEKLHVVGGDLTESRLGLSEQAYDDLSRKITLVVNSAATVTFDERLDLAVGLNTLGPSRLMSFARACGNVPMMHVSTCFVCGVRDDTVYEDFSAPAGAQGKLPRKADGEFDLDALVDSLQAEARAVCEKLGADTEACRTELINVGMQRARSYGWNDTYTFTKWLGEQLLIRDCADVPCKVFRPAIIEGSYDEPAPGWIDGLRMADPIIVAYGRGKLTEFPGLPDIPLDLIPVDFVANAMVATLAVEDGCAERPTVYHCASSYRHPATVARICRAVKRAFQKRPMISDDGKPIPVRPLKLMDSDTFVRRWRQRHRRVRSLRRFFERFHTARRRARKLAGAARQIEQLIYFAEIYSPYTHLQCRFADDHLIAIAERLHPDDRKEFPFDVSVVDWDDYIVNRHVPGVRSFVLGTGWEPSARIRAVGKLEEVEETLARDVRKSGSLFEIFRHSAERFPEKHALQIRRGNRWVRYTYDEALRATGTLMRRFTERGLAPGDRVAICGESSPEWGLTYLAAMRAGLTAVPLDPQLPPADVWGAVRFAGARLVLAGSTTQDGLTSARAAGDPEIVVMAQPFVPPPAASRDALPDPVRADDKALASILFTSGTTVAPKAVQLTHRNFIANAAALLQVHPVYSSDEFLSVLPMYHAFEFTGGFLVPLAAGSTITYVEHLKGPEIRGAMQATGTTVMLVVPRLIRMFHDSIAKSVAAGGVVKRGAFRLLGMLSDLTGHRYARRLFGMVHREFGGRLRLFVSGGARLDPELFGSFARLGFPVYEGYGLTETAPVLAVNPPGAGRASSVGPALPNVELEIRNPNAEGVGEVWARGPSVMSGYLDSPEATRAVLVDGWFRTGDLGRVDADGYLYLTGRSKDLIITGAGKNVYPDEVETRYRDLPYVSEVCVFGMPSADGLGDAVHAVVVLDCAGHPDLDPSSAEREVRVAVESISETLPPYQRIAVLHFWDRELPKTSTLKAKRNLIRETVVAEEPSASDKRLRLLAAEQAEGVSFEATRSNTEAAAVVRDVIAAQCRRPAESVKPHMHLLLDLGIDSIGKMDLLGVVEARFRMHIGDEAAAKVNRVQDLFNLIGERKPVAAARRDESAWQRRLSESGEAAAGLNGKVSASLLPIRFLMRGGVGVFMNTYVRVHAVNRENIPEKGGFVVAPNHSSHLDSPSVLTAVAGRRRIWVAGAEDYFFNTRLKRFIFGRVFDTIAFDRQADGIRGLKRCGDALGRGEGVLMFPEGTRSLDGALQPFKIGVAVLAIERNVPIIPVYIHNTYSLFRKGQRFVRPGRATVFFGAPIHPPKLGAGADHYAAFRELTEKVEKSVAALCAEAVSL